MARVVPAQVNIGANYDSEKVTSLLFMFHQKCYLRTPQFELIPRFLREVLSQQLRFGTLLFKDQLLEIRPFC